jgi:hypothetical protein
MFEKIISYLPYLGVAVSVNLMLGVYYNVAGIKEAFSWAKFFTGIFKAVIVSLSFIGAAVVFDKLGVVLALGEYTLKPDVVLLSAIALYLGKDMENLVKILGVKKLVETDDETIVIER